MADTRRRELLPELRQRSELLLDQLPQRAARLVWGGRGVGPEAAPVEVVVPDLCRLVVERSRRT